MERSSADVWMNSYKKMIQYYRDNYETWYHKYLRWFSKIADKFDRFDLHCRIFTIGK